MASIPVTQVSSEQTVKVRTKKSLKGLIILWVLVLVMLLIWVSFYSVLIAGDKKVVNAAWCGLDRAEVCEYLADNAWWINDVRTPNYSTQSFEIPPEGRVLVRNSFTYTTQLANYPITTDVRQLQPASHSEVLINGVQ